MKPGQKKSSSVVAGPSTVSSSPAAAKEPTKNGEKVVEKRKSELKVDKAEKHSEKKSGEEMKRASSSTSKAPSKSKKSPVEAPSKTDSGNLSFTKVFRLLNESSSQCSWRLPLSFLTPAYEAVHNFRQYHPSSGCARNEDALY